MALVCLVRDAGEAIRRILTEKELKPILRIDLRSTGCCDASLGIFLDEINEIDLIQEVEGLTFIISPEVHSIAGEVKIACADSKGSMGFILKSANPISEWDGFGVCHIKA